MIIPTSQKPQSGEPIRILRVITRLNIGGPARHTVLLSNGLTSRGFETLLVTGSLGKGEGDMSYLVNSGENEKNAGGRNFHLEVIPSLQRAIMPRQDLVALAQLIRLCRRFRPHIVHTHTSKAGLLGRLAGFLSGVPIRIHTFHGHIFGGYFSPRKTQLFVKLERFMSTLTHRFLALSEGQREDLCNGFKVAPRDKVEVVPLGFEHLEDLATDVATKSHNGHKNLKKMLALDKKALLVGTVGRIVEIKGIDLFIEAASHLHKHNPHVHFAIVGDGHLRRQLEQKAQKLGLKDHVHFLGWQKDLLGIYSSLDAFVLTSHNEGTPVAVIEALAAGVPVVATAVGGVPDVLEHGRLGALVENRNPREIANIVEGILQHKQKASANSNDFLASSGSDGANDSGMWENFDSSAVSSKIRKRYGSRRLLDDVEQIYRQCQNDL